MDAIVTSLKPDQIILFGSGARGELRDESDLDLLVIKETDDREQDEPVILPHGERDVDMLISTKDSAEAARQYAGDVRGKALETGVTVYTREGFTPIETGPALVPQGEKMVRRTLYKPDHAHDFLDRAERKWRTANTPQTHPADRCEYLQASMEQALKGLTIAQGRQITHSHNLNVLWDDAEKDGEKIAATRNDIELENLTKYAGKYQYWNPTPGMPEKTWRATQSIGEDVLKHAREKIPELVKKTNERLQGGGGTPGTPGGSRGPGGPSSPSGPGAGGTTEPKNWEAAGADTNKRRPTNAQAIQRPSAKAILNAAAQREQHTPDRSKTGQSR